MFYRLFLNPENRPKNLIQTLTSFWAQCQRTPSLA